MSTLISIIIPTYNRADEVVRAIESGLAQTHQPCEVIVVDDGSTDATPEQIARYGQRIQAVRQANQGRSAARNSGLRMARGEYVIFLDSDDALLPSMAATQLAHLQKHPHMAFAHGQAWMTDLQGRLVVPPVLMGAPLDPTQPPFASLVMGQTPLLHTALIRRSALEAVGDFEEGLEVSEDWDLWLRLAAQYDVGFTPGPLALCASDTAGYVERLGRYNVQKYTPEIIARAFTYLPAVSPLHNLRPRALARAWVQWGGCVEFALQHLELSWDHLRKAQQQYPELLKDIEVIPRGVAQFATWYQVDGAAFIKSFFRQLPPEFASWRSLKYMTLTLYHLKQAHLAWHQKRYWNVLSTVGRALWNNPSALGWAFGQLWRRRTI